jgi:hypothetical protein
MANRQGLWHGRCNGEYEQIVLNLEPKKPMSHAMSFNWTQLILIQTGILLQIAAICAFVRQRVNSARMLPPGGGVMPIKRKAKAEEASHPSTQRMNIKNWSPTRAPYSRGVGQATAHHFGQRQ